MAETVAPKDSAALAQSLKDQLKIDSDDDLTYLQQLTEQAEDVLIHAVDSTIALSVYYSHPMFVRAVSLLAGHWFFNRLAVAQVQMVELPYGVEMIINSLRGIMWGGDESGSDSGSVGTQ